MNWLMRPPTHLLRRPARLAGALACSAWLAAGWLLAAGPGPASAQVPPSSAEAGAYRGLHAAAHHGDLPIIRARAAADPAAFRQALEARDSQQRTPLHVATFAGRPAVVKALLELGARTDAFENGRYDAVTIAAVADDEATLSVLLEHGASAKLVTSRYDGTALIAAAHLGHDGVVRQLIAAGAPLDHINNLHWTAVIEAVVLGDGGARHQATLQALLAAGADRSITDRNGRTPLDLARERGYSAMVRMLEAPR